MAVTTTDSDTVPCDFVAAIKKLGNSQFYCQRRGICRRLQARSTVWPSTAVLEGGEEGAMCHVAGVCATVVRFVHVAMSTSTNMDGLIYICSMSGGVVCSGCSMLCSWYEVHVILIARGRFYHNVAVVSHLDVRA